MVLVSQLNINISSLTILNLLTFHVLKERNHKHEAAAKHGWQVLRLLPQNVLCKDYVYWQKELENLFGYLMGYRRQASCFCLDLDWHLIHFQNTQQLLPASPGSADTGLKRNPVLSPGPRVPGVATSSSPEYLYSRHRCQRGRGMRSEEGAIFGGKVGRLKCVLIRK